MEMLQETCSTLCFDDPKLSSQVVELYICLLKDNPEPVTPNEIDGLNALKGKMITTDLSISL